ncbi:PepSY domain-containing protein [Alkalicoccus luteus]|uniref:PepSY domain-containing protein n=1 Tax=Alkalicoccus luteus TaxID=1237094 RepID=UPI004033CC7C
MKKTMLSIAVISIIGGTSAFALAGDEPTADLTEINQTEQNNTEQQTDSAADESDRITPEQAVDAAKTIVDGQLDEVELDTENGRLVYEVELDYMDDDYDIKVDAYTGEVVKVDDDLLGTGAEQQVAISIEEAEQKALSLFDGGTIDDRELEKKNGRYVYELEVEIFDEDGDVYIDAESGEVIHVESDIRGYMTEGNSSQASEEQHTETNESGNSNEQISSQKAADIALNHVGKGHVDDIELERENGMLVYEVEVEYGDDDVDVYVDAFTGEVIYVDH